MAAMVAELLPWLIMRYLGEISYTEDRASRGRTGLGLAVLLRKAESNLCSAVCFLGAAVIQHLGAIWPSGRNRVALERELQVHRVTDPAGFPVALMHPVTNPDRHIDHDQTERAAALARTRCGQERGQSPQVGHVR
jgi:hypothetical protein